MDEDRQGAYQGAAGAMGDKERAGDQRDTGEGADLAKQEGARKKGSEAGDSDQPKDDEALSAQDDDIVARQLREAAEKETDPELKAKLWKEYRDYKKSL